jgi:AAA+ ATPase superfamily predicted ATPase
MRVAIMRFYNRENELTTLRATAIKSVNHSQMTFIVGRRRIGKTKLILECYQENLVYFFVSKKSEILLCNEFIEQIQTGLGIKVLGEFTQFAKLFEYLLDLSKTIPFNLAIDEFQEFFAVNASIYADMQNLWDKHKERTKLNLILSGSIYSMMHKIFENAKEPLYGRANKKMVLKAFGINTLNEIFIDYQANITPKSMLAFYTITGGVAKYVEIFADHHAFDLDEMLEVFFSNSSIFVHEGRDILIEEFGKDYTTYFSILSLIASSKTSRTDIESILGKSIGGYLERLENDFGLIKTIRPIFAKPNGRIQKYNIEDNFLSFWFRFIYKYQSAIEIENYDYIKSIIKEDFDSFSGRLLEKYFIEKLKLTKQFNLIGNYWERGHNNEIDIVAVNEREKFVYIAEVKISAKRINLNALKHKAQNLSKQFDGYKITYQGLSLDDMFRDDIIEF